jgi:hypothetical protein
MVRDRDVDFAGGFVASKRLDRDQISYPEYPPVTDCPPNPP